VAYKEKTRAIQYNNEFIKQSYDRINLTVPKGKKAEIQTEAAKSKESVNSFINRAIDEAIQSAATQAPETPEGDDDEVLEEADLDW